MDILQVALEEQARAMRIVAGLRPCPLKLSSATSQFGSFLVDPSTGEAEIRISRYITSEDVVRETARHELAHQAAWQRYEHIGHGPLWQTLAVYLGCEPRSCSSDGLDRAVAVARQRYAITCDKCAWTATRQRRSKLVKAPYRYRCSECGGTLRVARL